MSCRNCHQVFHSKIRIRQQLSRIHGMQTFLQYYGQDNPKPQEAMWMCVIIETEILFMTWTLEHRFGNQNSFFFSRHTPTFKSGYSPMLFTSNLIFKYGHTIGDSLSTLTSCHYNICFLPRHYTARPPPFQILSSEESIGSLFRQSRLCNTELELHFSHHIDCEGFMSFQVNSFTKERKLCTRIDWPNTEYLPWTLFVCTCDKEIWDKDIAANIAQL